MLLSGTAALASLISFGNPAHSQGVSTEFTVGGQVTAQRTFTLPDLQALPATTLNVTFLAGSSSVTANFTGPQMWTLLSDTVGLRINPAIRNDVLRNVVVATGSDGYQVVYALGEINPNFGGSATRPELVAYASTPGQLLTTDGFARTVEPGDIRGGRYVSNLVSLDVLHAPYMTGTFTGGLSTQFTVTGQVNTPATFNLATLTAMPSVTVTTNTPGTTFTGVPLWNLLQTVGVTTNPAVKNNILRDYVIATGSDGYQAIVSMGEINPDFGGNPANPIIVAYAMNGGAPGTSLGANGFARLITPDDNLHGRWVSNLINLEIFDISQWKILMGEAIDMVGFSFRTLGLRMDGGTLTSSLGSATLTAPSYVFNGGLIDTNVILGGSGPVSQIGGVTEVRGLINTTGLTTVSGGALVVNGAVTGAVEVQTNGTLGGNGSIGSLTVNGGTLSPGNSIGTLTVKGSLTFSTAASYLVQVSASDADRVNAGSKANLAGAVNATFASGDYYARNYTILTSTGLDGSKFGNLTTTNLPANFIASLNYTSTDVLVHLTAALGSSTPGLSRNQQNVATTINAFFNASGSPMSPSFAELFRLTGPQLATGLSQLSGEVATGVQQAGMFATGMFLNTMLDPFVEGRSGAFGAAMAYAPARKPTTADSAYAAVLKAPPLAPTTEGRWSVWGASYGGYNRTEGDAAIGSHDLHARAAGFAAGVDYRVAPASVLGVAVSVGETNWGLSNGLGKGNSEFVQVGGYASTRWSDMYLSGAVAGAWHSASTERLTSIGSIDRLTADFDTQSFGARFEGGRRFQVATYGITPYAAVQVQSVHSPAYGEAGSSAFALNYTAETTTDTRTELGAWLDTRYTMANGASLLLRARGAWVHDFDPSRQVTALFQTLPGTSFVVNGASVAKDAALVSAAAEVRFANGVSLIGKFDSELSGQAQTYAGTGTIRYAW